MTEPELKILAQEVAKILAANSQGVGEEPKVASLKDVYSLPANRKREDDTSSYEVVIVPIEELQKPALDAAEKANFAAELASEKATLADEKSILANTAANRVDDAILDITEQKQAALDAAAKANAAATSANTSSGNADAKAILANLAAASANAAATNANEKATLANEKAELANVAAETVDEKIQIGLDALVADAPEALDTLKELADALGNDPNFATTMATEIAKKVNKTDVVSDLTTGGQDKVASAETVKQLEANKVGSLFFKSIAIPMTSEEFALITPDPHTLYVVLDN